MIKDVQILCKSLLTTCCQYTTLFMKSLESTLHQYLVSITFNAVLFWYLFYTFIYFMPKQTSFY